MNNFATTEREITEMGLRLAGAGKQIGLSQGSIVGIAAALSSVGIEAEQGGSAFSKLMVSLQLAVEKGGESLESFAGVAGMTSDKFAELFKSKPEVALERFVKGLGESEKHGKSAIQVLDEMGITEVRLRDTLLRAANAGDLMTKAIEGGNKAFNENTALANEANKRYETTESKLKTLRNEAVNLGIELGGPLVDALRDGLQAAKPWLKTLSDMADRFSKLEPEQQRSILKWIAMGAAAGPTLKILGSGVTTIGGLFKAFGTLEKGLVNLIAKQAEAKVAATGISTALTGVGTSASVASGAGGLAGFASVLTGPVGLAIGGTVLALGAGYGAWKAWGEKAVESAERTRKWGTSVSEEAGKTLNKVQEFSTQSGLALDNFENKAKDNAKNVAKAFEDMQKTINQTVDEVNKKNKELIDNLPEELQKGAQKRADKIAETNQKLTESTQAMSNQVSAIYQRHNGDVSKFTDEEKQIIMNNRQSMMQAEVNLLFESGKKKQAIMKALNSDINSMSLQMAGEYSQSVIKAIEKSNKTYDDDVSNLKKSLKAGLITRKEYNSKTKQLTDEHEQMMQSYAEKLVQYYKKMYPNDTYKIVDELQKLGINYGDVVEKMGKHTDKAIAKNKLFAETTKKSSNEAIIANKAWNDMVFDEKTGKVKTNLKEVIASATDSEEAWQNLEFILKHANLTSNAKTEIAVAMGEAGKWNQLSVEQKQVIVNGDQSKLIMYDNINALGAWNSYEADVKKLGVDNADVAYKMFQSQDQVNQWNALPVNIKMMYANNADLLNKALQSGQALNSYASNNPPQKQLTGNSNSVVNAADRGTGSLNRFNAVTPGSKTMTGIDNASAPAKEATRNVRAFGGSETITKRFNIVASISGMARSALSKLGIHFAKGTNYHLGGPAIVNDQPGPTYKELVIPKGGMPFIPEGRDVFLPNLPRGSKVLTARQTKRLFPHYAEGVGIPKNARIFNLLNDNSTTESNVVDFSNLAKLLDDNRNQNEQIIKLLNLLASKQWSISAQDIANKSYRFVDDLQNRDKLRADLVNGR